MFRFVWFGFQMVTVALIFIQHNNKKTPMYRKRCSREREGGYAYPIVSEDVEEGCREEVERVLRRHGDIAVVDVT